MASRYRPLAVYSIALAATTGAWLVHGLANSSDFPAFWVVLPLMGFFLFVWQFGVPAPRVGLISMERLPQIGLVLVFSPPVAAAICAAASLLWPLVSRSYSHGSLKAAALRATHNAAMSGSMVMLAGYAYLAIGGRHPLDGLALSDVVPLLVMAGTMQVVNIALMSFFYIFDRRDVRRIITPVYAFTDLAFVPAGVLAAVLYNSGSMGSFGLFIALMVVFVLSFHGVGRTLSVSETESGPLARLSQARRALHGARGIDELGKRILTETRALFRFDEFYLVLVNREERVLDFRVHERREQLLPVRKKPLNAGLFGWAVERAQPVLVDNWEHAPEPLKERAFITDKETGSVIAVPLIEEGIVIGVLSVQHTQPGIYSDADLHLMQRLAEQVAAAVADAQAFEDLESYRKHLEERVAQRTTELESANQQKELLIAALGERSRTLERESHQDPLTGIANRRSFQKRLSGEIEVARTVGRPLTLAVADLDHFKFVNDRLGHAVGDEVLRQCAALMLRLCRATDLVARIGGEEFALILPGMTRVDAIGFCEHIRHAVETHAWRAVHPQLELTLSIGLEQWHESMSSAELLHAADTNLYRAKNEGRNRVA